MRALVSERSLEIRDLDETVTREEVVAALYLQLGRPDLERTCRLYKRFGGVQTAVVPWLRWTPNVCFSSESYGWDG